MDMYMYIIIDAYTGQDACAGKLYHSARTASQVAERMNQTYGAVRYIVRPI